jgi:hypothetical protein
MNTDVENAYNVLELVPGASLENVKRSWRELCKVWHPDRFPNDDKMQEKAQERLKSINRSYEILVAYLTQTEHGISHDEKSKDTGNGGDEKMQASKRSESHKKTNPNNRQESGKKRGCLRLVFELVIFTVLAGYVVRGYMLYKYYNDQFSTYNNIHIGESQAEVKYRLGYPIHVIGPPNNEVYTVSGSTNHYNNPIPSNTKVEDYKEWHYGDEATIWQKYFSVAFSNLSSVRSLTLYGKPDNAYAWGPIAGIFCGESEERIINQYGKPTSQTIHDTWKEIEYNDIGITLFLDKGEAYNIELRGPPNRWSVLMRSFSF